MKNDDAQRIQNILKACLHKGVALNFKVIYNKGPTIQKVLLGV